MRVAQYERIGPPDVIRIVDVADEKPGPGQIALRVRAAGLNPIDTKLRTGFIPTDAPFPRRVGTDVAGTVVAVGTQARYGDGALPGVGDEVLGRASGSIAERVVTAASNVIRRPPAVPVEVAGGLVTAGLTAVSCLATVPVGSRDTVLIGGGAGAVGLIAAQLAISEGARVIGTASERNHALLRSLGVTPVRYGAGLADRISSLTPITAVFDCHGREALDAGIALAVPKDRMVAIAAYAALNELGVLNVEREARTPANLAAIARRIAAGELVVPIAATYPLDEVVAAFSALESGHNPGKIVITP